MLVAAFGALLASIGVGVAVGAPLIGIQLERQAQLRREHEAALVVQREVIADNELTIAAYREVEGSALVNA
jgi:hypothetical protein